MQPDERLSGQERPGLPATHYLDNRIYTDPGIFARERESIFAKIWKFVCHETELSDQGDFRTLSVADRPLIVIRGQDDEIRTFFNVCVHRGARLIREPAGTLVDDHIQCFYHLWSYNSRGQCTGIAQPKGYKASGLQPDQVHLREVRTETLFGLVFVCLDEETEPLEDFLGPDIIESLRVPFGSADLEVFHFHRAEMTTNWKMFSETNQEGYHELLHVMNRKTGLAQKDYRERRWNSHQNGHLTFDQAVIGYQNLNLGSREAGTLPGMLPNGHVVVDLFPDVMLNCRSTVVRIDSLMPLKPGKTMLECRGLGRKTDTPEERSQRISQHNQVWGPSGRNLPEDIWAVETQWQNIVTGASRYSIIAREEDWGPMDDATLRSFYDAWGRRIGCHAHDIDAPWPAEAPSDAQP
jgi:methanesulfonate monooxygenase subunit alpha